MKPKQRPRRCAVCHQEAQWAEEEVLPTVTVRLDGTVEHGWRVVHTYYCDLHNGAP